MLEEKTLENEELEHTLARTFAEAEDLHSNLATCEDSCERLQGALEAQTIEHEKVNIKLSERTQELTEAQDEIRNISEKLSCSMNSWISMKKSYTPFPQPSGWPKRK